MKLLLIPVFFVVFLTTHAQTATTSNTASEEKAVKEVITKFLVAIGNYDVEKMKPMFAAKSNVSGAYLEDGKWTSYSMTIDEFLGYVQSQPNPTKYVETVDTWSVRIDEGMMAFVRADASLKVGGKLKSHNIDYFTLIKENGEWKIFNGTYVALRAAAGK